LAINSAIEGDLEEKLQSGNRGVEGNRRDATIHAVQLIAAQILGAGRVGRVAQESGEVPDGTDVSTLRLGGELAHPHVLDHALTQR